MNLEPEWLEKSVPAVAEFISEMDEELINDDELEFLYFLAGKVIAISLSDHSVQLELVADDLWKISEQLLIESESWCESGMELEDVPAEILKRSVQPEAINFALAMLVEVTDEEKPKDQRVDIRPDSMIPIIIQLEAIMRGVKSRLG